MGREVRILEPRSSATGTVVYKNGYLTLDRDHDGRAATEAPRNPESCSMSDFSQATVGKLAADIARITLASIPSHLEAFAKAQELLREASGEDAYPTLAGAADQDDPVNTQSKLFSLTYHVLGLAQRLEPAFQGTPKLWSTVEELRGTRPHSRRLGVHRTDSLQKHSTATCSGRSSSAAAASTTSCIPSTSRRQTKMRMPR